MIRILNYIGGSRNYGDFCIQAGFKNALNSVFFDKNFSYEILDLKIEAEINDDLVAYINKNYDLFIIGPGGLIMKGDGFKTVSGWQFNCSLDNFTQIKIPKVFYGVGYNVFPEEASIGGDSLTSMFKMFDRADYVSVRDDCTAALLQKTNTPKLRVTKDSAYALNDLLTPISLREVMSAKYLIGITCAGDKSIGRGDGYWPDCLDYIAHHMQLRGIDDYAVVNIPHCIIYDTKFSPYIFSVFKGRSAGLNRLYPFLYPEQVCYAPFIASVYNSLDCHIGDRWHSSVLSIAAQIPFASLGRHVKVAASYSEIDSLHLSNLSNEERIAHCLDDMIAGKFFSKTGAELSALVKDEVYDMITGVDM